MKKQLVLTLALLGFLTFHASAQVGVNVNISVQPAWGPVGYDYVNYYYLPDIEVYYNVPLHQYTWFEGGRWITDYALPPRYAGYDLYHGYKVVINEPNPWFHHDRYRRQYIAYRGRHDQEIIRDSHDRRYFVNPGHPEHRAWRQEHPNERHEVHEERRDFDHDRGRH